MLERGVPYWLGGGRYLEDRGLSTTIPDHLSYTIQQAYMLEEQWGPWGFTVLDGATGKVYRISAESWFRSLVYKGGAWGEFIKEDGTNYTFAEKQGRSKDFRMPQEWA